MLDALCILVLLSSVLPCRGQSLFTTAPLPIVGSLPPGIYPYGIVHSDFNNDGLVDALIGSGFVSDVLVLPGTPGGGVGQAVTTTFPPNGTQAQGPVPIVAWDVNQDGNLDAACWMTSGKRVILGLGNGSFSTTLLPGSPPPPWAGAIDDLAGGDLDGDGSLEVVVVGADAPISPTGSIITVYSVASAGFLSPTFNYAPTLTFLGRVILGDVTGDGLKDIVAEGYAAGQYSLHILQRTAAGGFAILGPFPWPGSQELVCGDGDADGTDDIVALTPVNPFPPPITVNVAYGSSSGTFSVGSSYPTGIYAGEVGVQRGRTTLADYDLDGFPELCSGGRLLRPRPTFGGNPSSPINPAFYIFPWPSGITGFGPQCSFDADGDGDLDVLITARSGTTTTAIHAGIALNRTVSGPGVPGAGGSLTLTVGTPAPGNPMFPLAISGAPSTTTAILGLSQGEGFVPLGPGVVRLDITPGQLVLPFGSMGYLSTNAIGSAQAMLSVPATPSLLGADFFLQWMAIDPTGPISLFGMNYSLSEARRIMLW
jgi:hypothetical protein